MTKSNKRKRKKAVSFGAMTAAVAVFSLLSTTASAPFGGSSFSFFNEANAAVGGPTCANLTVSKVVANANDGNVPANTIDNNLGTRWSNNGVGSYLKADLGAQKTICSVDIAWYKGNERTSSFVISVSQYGTGFDNVFSGKSSGKTSSYETYTFSTPQTARFVKITVNGNTVNDWASISEIKVNNNNNSTSSPTTTPTTTTTGGNGTISLPPTTTNDNNNSSSSSSNSTDKVLDKFGVQELFQSKSNTMQWFVNMADPTSDPNFRNLGRVTFTKMADGSWKVFSDQIRMEAWSPSNSKWLNVEMTEYAKVTSTNDPLLQMYSRGGHHSDNAPCDGSAYKGRFYLNGQTALVKELSHPAYAGNNAQLQATTDHMGKWFGFKLVMYNIVDPTSGKTYVHLETYVDDSVSDSQGNLVVKNNWKLASVYDDKGGWSTDDPDFTPNCAPVNKDSTQQYRQRDEIINTSGNVGKTENLAAFRSDGTTWQFKYLSVREIVPPLTSTITPTPTA